MKALLHFPSIHDVPEGVWWVGEDGSYREHYVDGSALRAKGVMVMSSMHPSTDPDEIFDYLTEKHSYFDVWAVVEVSDKSSPQESLELMRTTITAEKKALAARKSA